MTAMLEDKIILITGATSGIGETAARAFAGLGAKVALSGRRAKLGEKIAAQIRATGASASYFHADISRESEVEALVASVIERYGRLDAAFNNARVEARLTSLIESATADFDMAAAVNFRGTWLSMRAEARAMLARGGSIVNTSSWLTPSGFSKKSLDSAVKGAIESMTRAAALELADAKIRVNTIQRLGSPEEIATAAAWLCSDAAAHVTGQTIVVDGDQRELHAS